MLAALKGWWQAWRCARKVRRLMAPHGLRSGYRVGPMLAELFRLKGLKSHCACGAPLRLVEERSVFATPSGRTFTRWDIVARYCAPCGWFYRSEPGLPDEAKSLEDLVAELAADRLAP